MNPELFTNAINVAYDNAVKKGFHDNEYSDPHYIMMIITEISEVINADRNGRRVEKFGRLLTDLSVLDEPFRIHFEKYIKDTVEDEFADIAIRLFDFLGVMIHDGRLKFKHVTNAMNQEQYYHNGCQTMTEYGYTLVRILTKNKLMYGVSHPKLKIGVLREFIILLDQWIGFSGILDIWEYINFKMRYNTMRPKLNGKLY